LQRLCDLHPAGPNQSGIYWQLTSCPVGVFLPVNAG
jgi:hypothetical protein